MFNRKTLKINCTCNPEDELIVEYSDDAIGFEVQDSNRECASLFNLNAESAEVLGNELLRLAKQIKPQAKGA